MLYDELQLRQGVALFFCSPYAGPPPLLEALRQGIAPFFEVELTGCLQELPLDPKLCQNNTLVLSGYGGPGDGVGGHTS